MANVNYLTRWFPKGFRLIDGNKLNIALGTLVLTTDSAILATGVTQATAAPIGNAYTAIDPASAANSGVRFTTNVPGGNVPIGTCMKVYNPSGGSILIYPELGTANTINGGASLAIAAGTVHEYLKVSLTAWIQQT